MPSNNNSREISKSKYDDRMEELRKIRDTHSDMKEREKAEKKLNEYVRKLDKERIEDELKQRLKNAQEEGDFKEQIETKIAQKVTEIQKDSAGFVSNALASATSYLTSKLDGTINNYVSQIQALGAHLQGTNRSYEMLTESLNNSLSSQGFVRQQDVFNNLTKYVKDGITYNVEQRAFLKTIADDISLVFDGWTSSMNQLVRLQMTDSTANRLALEYSLQEFLNTNYKTSEYIANEFSSVSNALLASQSTMNARNAMTYEAIIQTWLGSFYSAGANAGTIDSLARAIDQLGSGDISGLGSNGISNLVLMGAARAGLDYGSILNQGLNANTTDQLLAGISSYLVEMNSNQSNVVRSQLGNIFGVKITDLMAANNMRSTTGNVSTDVSGLLNDYSGFTPYSVRFSNMLENFFYSWGTNIASNEAALGAYKLTNLIADTAGRMLEGVEVEAGLPFLSGKLNIGKLIQAAPLVALLPTLGETVGQLFTSMSSGASGLTGIFESLGNATRGSTVKISDQGLSGSAYFGTASSGGLLDSSINSLNDQLAGASVSMVEGDKPTIQDNVSIINDNVALIVELLNDHLIAIDNQLSLMGGVSTMAYTYAHDQGVSF